MQIRTTLALATAVVLVVASLGLGADESPKTSSGKPDLSGNYDIASLTPYQRDSKFGDQLYMTAEEAEQIVSAEVTAAGAASSDSDPNREAPPGGGDGSAGAAGAVGGYNFFWIDRGTDVFTVDGKFRTSIIVDPINGRMPKMTDAALARAMERRKLFRPNDGTAWWLDIEGDGPYDGPEMLGISERCILGFTGSTPTFPSLYNNYKRIVQTDDYVMILIEMVHDARIVRMNSKHPPAEMKSWLGDSIGWWESDTLVVDTANFHPKTRPGRGGSINAHVVERFSRLEDGNLLYRFTVEDPTVWTEPWTGEYIWRTSDEKLYEYVCHEGN